MNKAIVTTSWDDGHPSDLKLAELLKRYDIPATFYIPVKNMERESMNPQHIVEIAQSFDVGGHTYHHVDLTQISLQEAEREILGGKKRLEDIIGKELLSFCYPKGKLNDEIINIVKGAGFILARTVRLLTRSIKDPFRIGTTVHAQDHWMVPYIKQAVMSLDHDMIYFMLRNNLFVKCWDRIAIDTLNFIVENGGVWHLWGHSWEIEKNNDWGRLEEVLRITSSLSKEARKVDNSQLIKCCNKE